MIGHSFSQMKGNMQSFVKRFGKEIDKLLSSNFNCINIVSPINKYTAPDHHCQHRKVDPVKPANGQRMFGDDSLHNKDCSSLKVTSIKWVAVYRFHVESPLNLRPMILKNEQPAHDLRDRLLPCTYEIQNYIRKSAGSGCAARKIFYSGITTVSITWITPLL